MPESRAGKATGKARSPFPSSFRPLPPLSFRPGSRNPGQGKQPRRHHRRQSGPPAHPPWPGSRLPGRDDESSFIPAGPTNVPCGAMVWRSASPAVQTKRPFCETKPFSRPAETGILRNEAICGPGRIGHFAKQPPPGPRPAPVGQKLVQGRLRGVPRAEAVDLLVAFDPGKQPGPGIVANLHVVTPCAIPIRKMLDLATPARGFSISGSERNR